MAIEVSDLWPQSSGSSSLGAEMTNGGFTGSASPFAAIHANSGIFYDALAGQSGIIRFTLGNEKHQDVTDIFGVYPGFELSTNGGERFLLKLGATLGSGTAITSGIAIVEAMGGAQLRLKGSGIRFDSNGTGTNNDIQFLGMHNEIHNITGQFNVFSTDMIFDASNSMSLLCDNGDISITSNDPAGSVDIAAPFDVSLITTGQQGDITLSTIAGKNININSHHQVSIRPFFPSGRMDYQFGPYQSFYILTSDDSTGGPLSNGSWPIAHSGHVNEMICRKVYYDIFPSVSGINHLGYNQATTSIRPYATVQQNSGVYHNIYGSSGVMRYGATSVEISNDGGKTYSVAALIPTAGNTGDVFFENNGQLATNSLGLTYNDSLTTLGVSGKLSLKYNAPLDLTQKGPKPGSGVAQLQAINLAERPMFGASNSGMNLPYFFQPSLFNRFIFMALPSATTTIGTYGNTVTSVGTVSHPAPNLASGVIVNVVSAAGAGSTAGTGSATTMFCRGGISGINSGFFFSTRITLPDSNYDGLRAFVGLTDQTMAVSVGNDSPAGSLCGFQFSTNRGDVNSGGWQFVTMNGVTQKVTPTNISCSGNRIWDMYIYCPPFPNNDAIYWTLHDVSWNRISSGFNVAGMITKNTMLRAGIQINNITASARSISFQHLYCEGLS